MSLNDSFGPNNGFKLKESSKDINKNKKNKINNDIFNSIPIEIENFNNQTYEYYYFSHIEEKISFNLNNLFNIIKQIINNNQMKFFFTLKQISNNKYSKLVEAEILYMLIETNFKKLKHIWDKKRIDILYNIFIRIKNYSLLKKNYKEYDSKKNNEIKRKICEYEENYKKIDKQYKDKSDEVKNIKNKVDNQKKELEQINKIYNNLEEKYNELFEKNNELKEIISLSRQKSAKYNYEHDNNEEKIILDLQNKIKIKEKENEKQLAYYELFYQSMNDMLSHYESKFDTIKSTMNTTNQNI